jgi:hypothetical protein
MTTKKPHVISELLTLHNSLWDMCDEVQYFGNTYKVYKSEDKSFSRVLLPGKSGKNIIYMTQDLNESNYGTLAIQRAAKLGKTYRITWIIDPSKGDIGLIHTTEEFDLIEQYTSHGTMTLYHSDPKFMPAKSAY